jgi:hypothetical protein
MKTLNENKKTIDTFTAWLYGPILAGAQWEIP